MANVVIIGAGVIGLQTAVTLLDAGYKVTVIAEYWPGDHAADYTSPWAGAIWRTHATPDQVERCKWDIQSYEEWMRICEEKPNLAQKMGITQCPITIYPDADGSTDVWYAKHVKGYTVMSDKGSSPSASAHSFTSIALNPDTYLKHLQSSAKNSGATFVKAGLPMSEGFAFAIHTALAQSNVVLSDSVLVVNCTGLLARHVCNDQNMYPIRGQTLVVELKPQVAREILLSDAKDTVTYIVPRPGTRLTILGGTKDSNNVDPVPTRSISEEIQKRCEQLLATKGIKDIQIDVLAEQVGFRPGRKGGVRLEVENIDLGHGKAVKVIHNYGHAGAGYQASLGSAAKVLELLSEVLPV